MLSIQECRHHPQHRKPKRPTPQKQPTHRQSAAGLIAHRHFCQPYHDLVGLTRNPMFLKVVLMICIPAWADLNVIFEQAMLKAEVLENLCLRRLFDNTVPLRTSQPWKAWKVGLIATSSKCGQHSIHCLGQATLICESLSSIDSQPDICFKTTSVRNR